MNDELEMARGFYGFGCWEAPFWFIGPEPGGEGNDVRASVWVNRRKADLVDCKEFHDALVQEMSDKGFDSKSIWKVKRWYPESPEESRLQPTWKKLILLLMAYQNKPDPTCQTCRRAYQRISWGRIGGETCVIELLGLPAKGLIEGNHKEAVIQKRIVKILKKMEENKPKLVVMYGFSEEDHWKAIAGLGTEIVKNHAVKRKDKSTTFVYVQHPVPPPPKGRIQDWLVTNCDWVKLAQDARRISDER